MCDSEMSSSLLSWANPSSVRRGFKNIYHSCFVNSTIQCLLYTPPIQNLYHSCKRPFCTLSSLQKLYIDNTTIPEQFLDFLFKKTKRFIQGQQEDAHETLRFLIDNIYPNSIGNLIFGGTLSSTKECQKCSFKSEVNENFLDLSLEITDFNLERCLDSFCKKEVLDSSNMCYCMGCKKNTVTSKQFVIDTAPAILTFHLKRYGNNGSKEKAQLMFPEILDIGKYMRKKKKQQYELYAVLLHTGFSCTSGHYYSYVKGPDQVWYLANDKSITKSSIHKVLNDRWAYILFYKKILHQNSFQNKRQKLHDNL